MSAPLAGDRTFRNDAVRLADLTVHGIVIDGYEFQNCRILGPAVIVVNECTIVHCSWEAPSVDSIFWEVGPGRDTVVGAIHVVRCTFSNCRFEGVGLAGGDDLRQALESGFSPSPES